MCACDRGCLSPLADVVVVWSLSPLDVVMAPLPGWLPVSLSSHARLAILSAGQEWMTYDVHVSRTLAAVVGISPELGWRGVFSLLGGAGITLKNSPKIKKSSLLSSSQKGRLSSADIPKNKKAASIRPIYPQNKKTLAIYLTYPETKRLPYIHMISSKAKRLHASISHSMKLKKNKLLSRSEKPASQIASQRIF
jgi:hypothetical protein